MKYTLRSPHRQIVEDIKSTSQQQTVSNRRQRRRKGRRWWKAVAEICTYELGNIRAIHFHNKQREEDGSATSATWRNEKEADVPFQYFIIFPSRILLFYNIAIFCDDVCLILCVDMSLFWFSSKSKPLLNPLKLPQFPGINKFQTDN